MSGIDPYTKEDMLITERIQSIWSTVFFFKGWLNWLNKSKHTISNFRTSNAYECVELNAYSLINFICKFNDNNEQQLFLPFLFNYQKYESFFRHARSLTSTQSTVVNSSVNFTLLDFLQKKQNVFKFKKI